MTSGTLPESRLASVQMLRFLAAMAVLLLHAELMAYHTGRFLGTELVRPSFAAKGAFGVDLFFVISGFIMVHSSARLHGLPGARRIFLRRRLSRIVPLYWAGTLASLLWFTRFGPKPDLPSTLTSLAFIPYPSSTAGGRTLPLLEVGWTLNYEMLFYLLFAMAMGAGVQQTVQRLVLVLGMIVGAGALFALPLPVSFWTTPILLEFACGMALGLAHARGVALLAPLRAGMIALAAVLVFTGNADAGERMAGWGRLLSFGLAGALVLAATALGPLRLRAERLWNRGGDISYALYLVHIPLMLAVQMIWRHFHWPFGPAQEALFVVLVTALSLLIATLIHLRFERPMAAWLSQRKVQPAADNFP